MWPNSPHEASRPNPSLIFWGGVALGVGSLAVGFGASGSATRATISKGANCGVVTFLPRKGGFQLTTKACASSIIQVR